MEGRFVPPKGGRGGSGRREPLSVLPPSKGAGAGVGSTALVRRGAAAAYPMGACYNLFDAHELLEYSIASIRPCVSFVCVVYQKVSNFGEAWDPTVAPLLERLKKSGLVDVVIPYTPKKFTLKERKRLVSPRATGADLGGAQVSDIGDQFFNELMKRELGRQACLAAHCEYFMSLDCDEFYIAEDLAKAKSIMVANNYECGICQMRYYFKHPEWELVPPDEINYVPAIYKCTSEFDFRLACPYPFLIDPTRKLNKLTRLVLFKRSELEMHHMSMVRQNISSKVKNVSNRGNLMNVEQFLARFRMWNPSMPVIHPHPVLQEHFTSCKVRPNRFDIDVKAQSDGSLVIGRIGARIRRRRPVLPKRILDAQALNESWCANCGKRGSLRCGACKVVSYCSQACQKKHWKACHKRECAGRKRRKK